MVKFIIAKMLLRKVLFRDAIFTQQDGYSHPVATESYDSKLICYIATKVNCTRFGIP